MNGVGHVGSDARWIRMCWWSSVTVNRVGVLLSCRWSSTVDPRRKEAGKLDETGQGGGEDSGDEGGCMSGSICRAGFANSRRADQPSHPPPSASQGTCAAWALGDPELLPGPFGPPLVV